MGNFNKASRKAAKTTSVKARTGHGAHGIPQIPGPPEALRGKCNPNLAWVLISTYNLDSGERRTVQWKDFVKALTTGLEFKRVNHKGSRRCYISPPHLGSHEGSLHDMHGWKGDTLGSPALAFLRKELLDQFGLTEEIIRLLVDMPAAGPVAGVVPAEGVDEGI